jgi:hypothetical protein
MEMKEKEQMQQQQAAPQSAQHLVSVAQILNRVQAEFPQLTHEEAETVVGNVQRQRLMQQSTQQQHLMKKPTQLHVDSQAEVLPRAKVLHPQRIHEQAQIQAQKNLAGHHEPLRKDMIAPVRRLPDGAAAGLSHPTSAQKTPTPIVTSIVETHDGITGNAKDWRLPVGSWEDEIAQIDAIEKTNAGLIAYVQW